MAGSIGGWNLVINGETVTYLKNGSYYPYLASPGETTFGLTQKQTTGAHTAVFLFTGIVGVAIATSEGWLEPIDKTLHMGTFRLQPGETYYFRYELTGVNTSALKLVSDAVGADEIQKCRLLETKQ